ncbi:hypothetical protein N9332_00260 [Candidatus Pelagibacter sp.]|nr:hypothetical protein [Candidatus Pelagibacter sp.]
MIKKIILILFIFCNINVNAISASFKEASIALSNCADFKFEEDNKRWHLAKIPQWESEESIITPKIKDKHILAYQKKWPINWFEHRDEIIKRRGDVYNKFFEYVLRNTSEIYLKKINELEDKAQKKLADAKKINPDFFKSKSDVDPSYFSNKFELFKEASKEIESNQLIKILREIDKHNEWEEKNYQARLAAIAKSKFLFFTNMSTKEKLKIKSYNKMHLKCENEYNRGQITFIQTWK